MRFGKSFTPKRPLLFNAFNCGTFSQEHFCPVPLKTSANKSFLSLNHVRFRHAQVQHSWYNAGGGQTDAKQYVYYYGGNKQ